VPPPAFPTPPATVADFWARYGHRDFKRGAGVDAVTDNDVTFGMRDAMKVFNAKLFSAADGFEGFLYLTAHFVRVNIQAAGGLSSLGENEGLGIENQGEQVIASAGAGGLSQNFVEPPEFIKKTPLLLQLWGTTYGQKYVAMLQPKLAGNVGVVCGGDGGSLPMPNVPFAEY
jgi:hypothetical protein